VLGAAPVQGRYGKRPYIPFVIIRVHSWKDKRAAAQVGNGTRLSADVNIRCSLEQRLMVGSATDPTAALWQAPATRRLAQVVGMRTDARRSAL